MNRRERRAARAKGAPGVPHPAVGAALEEGVRHHRAGRLQQAEQSYQTVLRLHPDNPSAPGHADALNLLGVVRMQSGRPDEAVELISRAVRQSPSNPTYLSNLGTAHLERGATEDAIGTLREALLHDPGHVDARYNLGNALKQSGAADEALDHYLAIVERHPGHAQARNNSAICLLERHQWEPAIAHLTAAIEVDPSFADAHANLAMALCSLDRFDEAEPHCRQALARIPDQTAALVCLGNVHRARQEWEQAVECFGHAAAVDPTYGAAFNNLGNALDALGRYDEALTALGRATELAPDSAGALANTGNVLKAQGRLDEAIGSYDAALGHDPGHRDARFGRALAHLLQGRFADGWSDYLARESMAGRADGFDRSPLPAGLSGLRCLVELDQGLGDEIFFLRFAPALRARGARVAYRPDPRLAAMLRRASIVDEIIADDIVEGETPTDGWDRRIAVGDLPYVLDAGAEPPPPSIRLAPVPELARDIAERLAAFGPPPHIGLTWRAGSRGLERSLYKNVALDRLAGAVRRVPGTIVAMQRAPEADELDRLAAGLGRAVLDLTALNSDLEAMLALVGALDDYVCVSNTNVHLRAAVGRRSRVLVPNPPEFRWMARGAESPWFPGTTVYRQDVDGDWAGALDQLGADLIERHGAA